MSFLPGFKKLWNSIKTIIAVVILIAVIIIAWEAIVFAFSGALPSMTWLGALETSFGAVAKFAAVHYYIFAGLSLLTIGLFSPQLAHQVVDEAATIIGDVVDAGLELVRTVAGAAGSALGGVLLPVIAIGLFVMFGRDGGKGVKT